MSRRTYGCPLGHDAGAYAPAAALMGADQGVLVDNLYPFKALCFWVDGRNGVSESTRDSWDYRRDGALPLCLECHEKLERVKP